MGIFTDRKYIIRILQFYNSEKKTNFLFYSNNIKTNWKNNINKCFFNFDQWKKRHFDLHHLSRSGNQFLYLKVCHPCCVKSIIQCTYCVYIYIYMQSKTQHFVKFDKFLCFWLHVYINIYTTYTCTLFYSSFIFWKSSEYRQHCSINKHSAPYITIKCLTFRSQSLNKSIRQRYYKDKEIKEAIPKQTCRSNEKTCKCAGFLGGKLMKFNPREMEKEFRR